LTTELPGFRRLGIDRRDIRAATLMPEIPVNRRVWWRNIRIFTLRFANSGRMEDHCPRELDLVVSRVLVIREGSSPGIYGRRHPLLGRRIRVRKAWFDRFT
jgi:hypothetical protein